MTRVLARGGGTALVVALVLLVGLNLRAPIVALAPVASELRADLGLSAAVAGLFTSLPVLCFGITVPIAVVVIRRLGADAAVAVCLAGVLVATLVRAAGPTWLALTATVLLGISITVGNVVVPVLIRREVPSGRVGLVTGAYTASLNVGTMLVSVATAPLAELVGWRAAVTAWVVLAVVAGAVWLRWRRRRVVGEPPPTVAVEGRPRRPLQREPVAWLLVTCFAAQAFSYYGLTTWLPTLLADERGFDAGVAGAASSVFQIAAVIGAFGVPLLGGRLPGRVVIALVGLCWCVLPVGMLLMPELFLLWSLIGGAAQGGGFAAVFTIVVRVAIDSAESTVLSGLVQGVAYVVAASAPPLLGAVHDLGGSWSAPLWIVLGATTTFTIVGFAAATAADRRTASPRGPGRPS